MLKNLDRQSTVLIVPANDAEAVQIIQIARKLKIDLLVSNQPHGARLQHEPDIIERIQETGKDTVVVVEIPGPGMEQFIKSAGFHVFWIDHHRYDDINRMTDPDTGNPLPSSLEQFLAAFNITDSELRNMGLNPKLVKGVGAMDRGFVWALKRDGYSQDEIKQVSKYVRELSRQARGTEKTDANEEEAVRAWANKKKLGDYILVTSDQPKTEIRPVVSLMAVEEYGQPTPMIISSRGDLLIYVQETPRALDLYKKFGGFTFGQDTCWGHNNAVSAEKITLNHVLEFLELNQHYD